MTELEVLKEMYDCVMQKVFIMSGNWSLTIPKKGCEEDWKKEKEMSDILAAMIKERE